MTPSADDILACETAHALFGDAVHDRRGLKRSYAALIKVYDPDHHPDVFSHIRALYEAARRGDTGAPEPEPERPALHLVTDDTPTPEDEDEDHAEARASDRLRAAMEASDAEEALAILEAHDLDLHIENPGLWFASVGALADTRTFSLPADLLQSWLDAVDGAPELIPDTVLHRIELLTSTGIAYRAARQDPAIDSDLLDLIAQWGSDPVAVADAFLALGEAMPDPEEAWAAHRTLKERYPELWFPYMLMAQQVTREVDSFDERKAELLHAPRDPAWQDTWTTSVRSLPWSYAVGVLLMTWIPVGVLVARGASPSILLVLVLVTGAVLWEARRGRRLHRQLQDYGVVSQRLVERARAEARFPHEALDLALFDRPMAPTPTLLRWQQDPTALLRVLTPAHIERVRARLAQEAE